MRGPLIPKTLLVAAAIVAVALAAVPAAPAAAAPADGDPPIGPTVVGGVPATEAYPFAASLQTLRGDHFCGAALIRPNWLATARHCVEDETPSSFRARIGSTNRTSGGTVVRVSRIVNHPRTDAAVVQLASPVGYPPLDIASSVPTGSPIRLLGWGATVDPGNAPLPAILQQLDTTVFADSRCGTGAAELCVGNVDGWRGACYGDSGGPAVIRAGTGWQLAGTTTAGTSSICGRGPAIYMDSSYHKPWIDSIAGPGGPTPPGKVSENGTDRWSLRF
jgi:secreted trypsin-like serine protease